MGEQAIKGALDHRTPFFLIPWHRRKPIDLRIVHLQVVLLSCGDVETLWQYASAALAHQDKDLHTGHQLTFSILIQTKAILIGKDLVDERDVATHLMGNEVKRRIAGEVASAPGSHVHFLLDNSTGSLSWRWTLISGRPPHIPIPVRSHRRAANAGT